MTVDVGGSRWHAITIRPGVYLDVSLQSAQPPLAGNCRRPVGAGGIDVMELA
jgi:hypothetical protein